MAARRVWTLALILTLVSCTRLQDPQSLEPGQSPLPGVTYRYTVFSHCGIWELSLGGEVWTPSNIERGSSPEGTDPMSTAGLVRLESEELLVFESTTGMTIEFVPAPPDLPPPPGCD